MSDFVDNRYKDNLKLLEIHLYITKSF